MKSGLAVWFFGFVARICVCVYVSADCIGLSGGGGGSTVFAATARRPNNKQGRDTTTLEATVAIEAKAAELFGKNGATAHKEIQLLFYVVVLSSNLRCLNTGKSRQQH